MLSKQEKRIQKKIKKEKEREGIRRRRMFKNVLKVGLGVIILGGGISGFGWFLANQEPLPEEEIISKGGLHWHPELSISILGEKQKISANIGLGITEKYIHTHDSSGVIHLEFPGRVLKNDIRLASFFDVWGKRFTKDCIFDKCRGSEGELKILVNGKENNEFENYLMRDKDKIEIIFE